MFSRSESGGARVLTLGDGHLVELTRYERDPWFHRTIRLRDTFARLDRNRAAITLLRMAATYEDGAQSLTRAY